MTGLKLIGAALLASFTAHHWGEPRELLLIDTKARKASASATPSLPARPRSGHGIPASDHPEVVKVVCLTGTGTAFRVSPALLLSVAHVTKLSGCGIGKNLIKQISAEGDFSVVSDGAGGPWLTVDCIGFVKGRRYVAVGYARGLDTITEVELTAEGRVLNGFDVLTGVFTVVPGQSGGPVIDRETGRVVGAINAYDPFKGYSAATALKDTTICKKGQLA